MASLAFGVLLSLTTQVTTGRHFSELRPSEALSMNLLGVELAHIVLVASTAMTLPRQSSTRCLQVSLSLPPARMRFFAAKLLTHLGLSLVLSAVAVSLAYLSSQFLLVLHGMPPLSL